MASSSQAPAKLNSPVFITADQLKPGSSGHNLVLKVVSSQIVVDKQRPDGTKIQVSEAVVGDHTGCITLTARNDQIKTVQAGNTIIIRNSKIDMFKGFMRLAVDKWGTISLAPQPATFQVKTENNLSTVEYELVTINEGK